MSLIDTIKNTFVPIHREGHKFIVAFFAGSVILGFVWFPLFWVGMLLTAWCIYFFRDPERFVPQDDDLAISPADGKVSLITMARPPAELMLGDQPMLKISVFMNVFNVHSNRAPVDGTVERVTYFPGKFVNADLDKASEHNERNALLIRVADGSLVSCVQVAGLVARRILCYVQAGDRLARGQRFGFIRFGSRVDVYLPLSARPRVAIGEKVHATTSVLAELQPEGAKAHG